MPELFGLPVQRRTTADHRPELPTELPPHIAKCPPAPQKVLRLGRREAGRKCVARSRIVQITFDLLLQRLDHPWNRHQDRHLLPPNRSHHFRRVERVFEYDRSAKQRRKKDSQELSKHVAQRQKIEEANRMHPALVL